MLGREEGLESSEVVVVVGIVVEMVAVVMEEVVVVVVVMVATLSLVHAAPAVSVDSAGSRPLTCSQMEAFKQQA